MIKIIYFFRVAFHSMLRHPAPNLVASATIAVALLIMGAFLLLHTNLQRLVQSSAQGLFISVYLEEGLGQAAIDRLKKEAADIPGVRSVGYISREQALKDLKSRLGAQGDLLEGLDVNPLPASLELELAPDVRLEGRVEGIIAALEEHPGVDEVHYAWEWADKLKAFVRFVRLGGIIIGGLLFLAIVFIISNTIRLTLMARKTSCISCV